ncbi:MAG: ATPase [Chthoniobacteraceae bacterium]|nr:ATPase [Chthoniobacteraceae bacterium]
MLARMKAELISSDRAEQLKDLKPYLTCRVLGQDHVIPRVASVLYRGELGLTPSKRPRGSFLFLGPTGVGKTELAIEFTRFLFGDEHLFRFDMSEYQTQASLGVLLGGRLGETGLLAKPLEKFKVGTLLFDEIEKAHPRVLDILLQILDAARVTMASGETLDLGGFYIVLTSNLGSAEILNLQHSTFATMERHVLTRAFQSLRPEFYARITEKLVFNRLTFDVQLHVAAMLLDQELARLRTRGLDLTFDATVLPFLLREGFHPRLGARPLRDAIQKHVGDACTEALLAGSFVGRGALTVNDGGLMIV